jgi:hypothetical protein
MWEMDRFTHETFWSLLSIMDEENNEDFNTFVDAMSDKFDILFDSDIEEVVTYITDNMGLESDMEITNMSQAEISVLSQFINELVDEIYEGE